jgi:hypothetical protein
MKRKCLVCGINTIETDICITCNNWYIMLYYKYVIYPYLLTNKAENWHENC